MPKNSHFLSNFSKIAIKSRIFNFSKNPSVNTGGITWVISSNFQKNITIHVTPDFAPGAHPIIGIFKAAMLDFGRPYWKFCQFFFFLWIWSGKDYEFAKYKISKPKTKEFPFLHPCLPLSAHPPTLAISEVFSLL